MEEIKDKLVFEPLGANHDRAAFSCGIPQLDKYLQTQARQDAEKHLTAVFILTNDSKTIVGYYTLSQHSIHLDSIPEELAKKLTKMPDIPATLIGRLARSNAFRGKGVGEILLTDALKRSLENSRQVASWAVIVDAKDAESVAFYKRYGFLDIPKTPNRLFVPMRTVEKMFSEEGA